MEWLGKGIYSLSEAAKLSGVSRRRISRWVMGYQYDRNDERRSSAPVWQHELPIIEATASLSFMDLIEVRFIDAFIQHGVSWKYIRRAAERAAELYSVEHPFVTTKFRTDGRTIFADITDEESDDKLLDLVKSQFAFKKVVAPYLYKGLEFDTSDRLTRWWPLGKTKEVVLDPARSFGQPIVVREGVPTSVLSEAFDVEQSVECVAKWYDVRTKAVRDAIAFEAKIAA